MPARSFSLRACFFGMFQYYKKVWQNILSHDILPYFFESNVKMSKNMSHTVSWLSFLNFNLLAFHSPYDFQCFCQTARRPDSLRHFFSIPVQPDCPDTKL